MSSQVSWGQVPINRWQPVEGSSTGYGIVRTPLRLKVRLAPASADASGKLPPFQWVKQDDTYVMDLEARSLDDLNARTLGDLARDLQQTAPKVPERDARVEAIESIVHDYLRIADRHVAAGLPLGLTTPENIIQVVREDLDFLKADRIRRKLQKSPDQYESLSPFDKHLLESASGARRVVLPDAGFIAEAGGASSEPSWISNAQRYSFLWDEKPVDVHRKAPEAAKVIRSASRLIGWSLSGKELRKIPVDESIPQVYGGVWSVLQKGESGEYATVEEFRAALENQNLRSHRFDVPWQKTLAPTPTQTTTRRFSRLLVPAITLLILLAWLAWKDWPVAKLNDVPLRGMVGLPIPADLEGTRGQAMFVQWDEDAEPQALDSPGVETHEYDVAGVKEIEVLAKSKLFWLVPMQRVAKRRLVIQEPLGWVNTSTQTSGQYLRVRLKPEDHDLPNDLEIELQKPSDLPDATVGGRLLIGDREVALALGETTEARVTESGLLRIEWRPEENSYGIHGEFLDILFPEDDSGNPIAGFELSPVEPQFGQLVHLDPIGTSPAPNRRITEMEVDWGDGKGWAPLKVGRDFSYAYTVPKEYTVQLRVRDDQGATDVASRVVNVVDTPLPLEPAKESEEIDNVAMAEAIQDRADKMGAKSGEVTVSLYWYNKNDLDLLILTNRGERLYFKNRNTSCGGELDIDENIQPVTSEPIENAYWKTVPNDALPLKVYVIHYKKHSEADCEDCQDPSEFVVKIDAFGRPSRLIQSRITFARSKPHQFIAEIDK